MKTLDEFFEEGEEGSAKRINEGEKKGKKELYGYELPEDWRIVELGEIFREVNKKERKTKIEENKDYKLILTRLYAKGVELKDVKSGREIKAEYMYVVKEGDFIFSKINVKKGAFGFIPAELDGAVVTSEHPILAIDEKLALRDFVFYYLSQPLMWDEFRRQSKGFADKSRTKVPEFLSVKISLPPLEEQKKIVYVLRTIQRAIEYQDKIIETTRELKKSLMHRLFTKGLDASQPTKLTEIGEVPGHWEVVELGQIANTTSGGTPSRNEPHYWNGSIPWVKSGELNDNYIVQTEETITKEGLENSSAKIFPSGTLLIAMYGATAGKTGILGIDAATNQAVCAIFPKNNSFAPEFMRYYLIYARNRLLRERYGGAQPNISQRVIKSFKVVIPPTLQEQKHIAKILQTVDRKIEIAKRKKEALQSLFKTTLHKLMTAQIRVKDLEISTERLSSELK